MRDPTGPGPEETVSLQEAARRLGVHYMTAYRYVRLGMLPAAKERGEWRIRESDLHTFRATAPSVRRRGAPWADRLEARLLAGDSQGAWGVVEAAMNAGTEPAEIHVEVLAPALVSVGERWAAGQVSVEDEHVASAIAARLIGRLGPRFSRRGRSRGTVVAATPPGERHGLGLAMLADVLRGEGFDVLELGPDTPGESLLAAVGRVETPAAVCLSVVCTDMLDGCPEVIDSLRDGGSSRPILLGGWAVRSAGQAADLGADGWSGDAIGAARLIGMSLGGHPPS